jgi:hypothetical protein
LLVTIDLLHSILNCISSYFASLVAEHILLCDNSNLSYKGTSKLKMLDQDGFHLSEKGSAVLASNIKQLIDHACNTNKPQLFTALILKFNTESGLCWSHGNFLGYHGRYGFLCSDLKAWHWYHCWRWITVAY